jgi:signal transduction histidine kinase
LLPVQQQFLQDIRDFIDQSITNTQTLTFELCPPILYELSFEAAIEWLTEKIQTQHNITIEFHDDRQPKHLAEDVRVLLFQAIREVLVNIVKHAEAGHACVSLSCVDNTIHIDISDDGIGFDAARKTEPSFAGGGYGLFNIRERLTYLGGHLEISSAGGAGTRVIITAPLQRAEA